MNFAGNAQILGTLPMCQTMNDVSRPEHVYVVMDGAFNCLMSYTVGTTGAHYRYP